MFANNEHTFNVLTIILGKSRAGRTSRLLYNERNRIHFNTHGSQVERHKVGENTEARARSDSRYF